MQTFIDHELCTNHFAMCLPFLRHLILRKKRNKILILPSEIERQDYFFSDIEESYS